MSLHVALQSVAFYVLSCSTCAKISHRRKAKAQAKRERVEKQALETEQPGLYRHPSPFNTNPYWTEEIMMGPGPPKQKGGSKNTSQRALHTGGQGSSYAGSTALSSNPPSSPTNVTEDSRMSGDGWNRKRYQREDEDLWGHDIPGPGQRIMDAIARASNSAGRLLEGRLSRTPLKEEQDPSIYYTARNPPVNDLHPPVVSSAPSNKEETRWMLQPPPAAKIMEGKERVNRSRASSNGSSRRGGDEIPLSRQVTERLVDARLQRGETPTPYPDGRPLSSRNKNVQTAVKPSANLDPTAGTSNISIDPSDAVMKRNGKPPPIAVPYSGISSRDTIEHIRIHSSPGEQDSVRDQASRPVLPTITSSSVVIPQLSGVDNVLQPTTNEVINSRASSLSHRLSPNSNSMPAIIDKDSRTSTPLANPLASSSIENVELSLHIL